MELLAKYLLVNTNLLCRIKVESDILIVLKPNLKLVLTNTEY